MASIAHDVGALLFVDMAHIAGLVAAGVHPSPFPHADLVTTTTHKTLRGPRGGMIFSRRTLPARTRRGRFPTVKNGAAMARSPRRSIGRRSRASRVARSCTSSRARPSRFKLAAEETFRDDQRRTVENAAVMAETLAGLGARVVSGGTDNHLMLVDVTPLGVTGKEAEHLLDEIGITVNKNAIPFDTLPPNTASGIRIGTPAATTRGFGPDEMRDDRPDDHRRDPPARRAGRAGAPVRRGPRDRRPVPGAGPAGRVTVPTVAAASPAGSRRRMTFIPNVGDFVGPIVVVFVLAALIAFAVTPVVRRRGACATRSSTGPRRAASTRTPVPRGGGLAVVRRVPARRPRSS